jgi:hypothetical protein
MSNLELLSPWFNTENLFRGIVHVVSNQVIVLKKISISDELIIEKKHWKWKGLNIRI